MWIAIKDQIQLSCNKLYEQRLTYFHVEKEGYTKIANKTSVCNQIVLNR